MEQDLFVRRKTEAWQRLDALTSTIRTRGIRALPPRELMSFSGLYRRTCADLAYARTHGFDRALLQFLNGCVGRAHAELYRDEPFTIQQVLRFYGQEFPDLVRMEWGVVVLSFLFFLAGAVFSFSLVYVHPEYASYFMDEHYIQNIERSGERPAGAHALSVQEMSALSHRIMTNNISVGIKACASGIFLGLGTVYILVQNGTLIGALAALCALHGRSMEFWSLILPHGVLELVAIFICGGAGFLLARWLLDPGMYERKEALRVYGFKAARLMIGVLFLFVLAAVVEGFFTPLPITPWFKLLFSLYMAVLLALYFGRREGRGKEIRS